MVITLSLIVLAQVRHITLSGDGWVRAEGEIRRLPPSDFADLPPPISAYLERRGCTIPQSFVNQIRPHNVIKGEFSSRASRDWAVLCSRSGFSVILVFAHGEAKPFAEIASRPDSVSLQLIPGTNKVGYGRQLLPAIRSELLGTRRVYGGSLPQYIDHEGIDDGITTKNYTMYYRVGPRWWALPGGEGVPMVEEP